MKASRATRSNMIRSARPWRRAFSCWCSPQIRKILPLPRSGKPQGRSEEHEQADNNMVSFAISAILEKTENRLASPPLPPQ